MRTREQKVSMLELMLGQMANYCPIISRNTVVKNSTSIENIWQTIRLHYGFQSTGAHFIDFAAIHFEPNERPEDLYQRVMAFVEDNPLRRDTQITHHGGAIEEDEEMTPSLENFVVLTWLRMIHTDLPKLVKQRYGTKLRSRTLSSIKPEVSSLLEELRNFEDAKVMQAATINFPAKSKFFHEEKLKLSYPRSVKSCPLCKAAGRPDHHFLSKCSFLPNSDRKYMVKARQIPGILHNSDDESSDVEVDTFSKPTQSVNRAQVHQ
ncbi:unnamed protein product [Mytilus coruscus]|uniref:Uncharacterized protein n=1 Tax=Mytilus coruscus TaxID=42192 RepID=A0A6J8F191_MYTCO|nr:unnamed protein product [Mytilus coruscus]